VLVRLFVHLQSFVLAYEAGKRDGKSYLPGPAPGHVDYVEPDPVFDTAMQRDSLKATIKVCLRLCKTQ
jgi:hypothetical protein